MEMKNIENKKYNKVVLAEYSKYLDGEDFKVIVLDDNDYYNIHIISEKFKDEELNTLYLQEDKESVDLEHFSEAHLIVYLMEFFIWDRFYKELQENDLQIACEVC